MGFRKAECWNPDLSSPKGFKEGESAKLQALNINHQNAILGIRFSKPRLINKLRVNSEQWVIKIVSSLIDTL
jgi:hypothetical protein